MRISFFTSRIEFNGDSLETRGLGGSESALINLTRSWKKLYPSDELTVFARCTPKIYNGIEWKKIEDFCRQSTTFDQDIVVSLREPQVFSMLYIDSKINVLWSQDVANEPDLQILRNKSYVKSNIDVILSVSNFAKKDLEKYFPDNEIILLRNGYNSDCIKNVEKENVAVYTSTPFRGLKFLVNFWPKILSACRNYDINPYIKIFGDMSLYNQENFNFEEIYKKLEKLENTKVVKSIPQKELYKELNKSKVMLYPCNYIESSCMSILEALACKVSVVTTDLGALSEQVINGENGYLCKLDSDTFEEEFIQMAVKAFLEYDNFKFPKTTYSWNEQAIKLRKIFEGYLE